MNAIGERARTLLAGHSFTRAAATMLGVIASFFTVYALCRASDARAAPAVLAAILAITLSRRPHALAWSRALSAPVAIAFTALAATGVAWLLHTLPLLGAIVFIALMFLSIWLRNFGERLREVGASLAMPLVALLIVPARADAPGGPLVDLALVVWAGVVPLAYVTAIAWITRRFGWSPRTPQPATAQAGERAKRTGMPVATRMALQMTVALAAAFVAGFSLFRGHWGWTVLTAFIVCSGARGRGDAAYKGVLRFVGAVGGTLAAAALARLAAPTGAAEAALIFAVLFIGLWLREFNYAYWAACMTLILALLARSGIGESIALLGIRLEAIFVGALCAVAATWFVYPIRTEAVIRRRLADALRSLDDSVERLPRAIAESQSEFALFEHHMAQLESVAAPVRWHRRVFRAGNEPEHPARWVELAHQVKIHARAFVPKDGTSAKQRGAVRRAIGASRRAIAEHGKAEPASDAIPVSLALGKLRDTLDSAQ